LKPKVSGLRYYSGDLRVIDDRWKKRPWAALLGSDVREQILGVAEVRDVFRSPKVCRRLQAALVIEGTIPGNRPIRGIASDRGHL